MERLAAELSNEVVVDRVGRDDDCDNGIDQLLLVQVVTEQCVSEDGQLDPRTVLVLSDGEVAEQVAV